MAYVCFITDAFSRHIVGWRVASHMRTAMVLDALEMARWSSASVNLATTTTSNKRQHEPPRLSRRLDGVSFDLVV